MNRIVTRGFGPDHLIVTRGYGTKALTVLREVLRLCSCLPTRLNLVSEWKRIY